VRLPNGVYRRDFEHGAVYMSGLDVETAIALPPGYTLSSSVVMPAKSAAFVLSQSVLMVSAPAHLDGGGNWYAHSVLAA
jgi:hypothetical protein